MQDNLPTSDFVLLGVGHTNAHVLRMWKMRPIPDVRLTCISPFSHATYSGMLPGVLAGDYTVDDFQIDLVRLCRSANARLIIGDVTGVDLQRREISFADRAAVPFDGVSIGIGSVPDQQLLRDGDTSRVLLIKPMQTFLHRLQIALKQLNTSDSIRVLVVGGGAGGIEVALCCGDYLRSQLGHDSFSVSLAAGGSLGVGLSAAATRRVNAEFVRRDIQVLEKRVSGIDGPQVTFDDGQQAEFSTVIWAVSAVAGSLLERIDVAKDDRGFLLTRPTLQLRDYDAPFFAVGDSGTIADSPTHKAGVYAVRQGPILWDNVRRVFRGESLKPYHPQRKYLKLLNVGNRQAIVDYGGMSTRGRWCWRLKDGIDRTFMAKYQDYSMPDMKSAAPSSSKEMRCAGCGGKVGGSVLRRVFDRLAIGVSDQVELGLSQPDDVAVIRTQSDLLAASVDVFAAPLDDPHLVGRIAALNSLSDLYASGCRPTTALAIVGLPHGTQKQQEELLFQVLSGGTRELVQARVELVGGHTMESDRLTIGFTVLGYPTTRVVGKTQLRAGDQLILTKPLGTGALLAAHMQASCRGEWFAELCRSMLLSNESAAVQSEGFDVSAMTDVTGFGFAGHLLEMLVASGVSANIKLAAIPLLPGAESVIESGIESTLAPANRDVETRIRCPAPLQSTARYRLLFDPQTNGGLVIGVSPAAAEQLLRALAELHRDAAVVGEVRRQGNDANAVELVIE